MEKEELRESPEDNTSVFKNSRDAVLSTVFGARESELRGEAVGAICIKDRTPITTITRIRFGIFPALRRHQLVQARGHLLTLPRAFNEPLQIFRIWSLYFSG